MTIPPDATVCRACDGDGFLSADDDTAPQDRITRDSRRCDYCRGKGYVSREKSVAAIAGITDAQIHKLKEASCECRPLPRIGGSHAAIHDCDDEIYNLCCVALGDNPYHSPRSTAEALAMQIDARVRCAKILKEKASR